MCGIAGFTHSNGRRQPERIWEITRSLIHRGPDQQDVWESANVSLGAVRLKIIDLEHGDQPMVSDDGDTVLVFNGEIYNHAELRRELEALGHRFDSRCDTEVVLRAFLEWDVRVVRETARHVRRSAVDRVARGAWCWCATAWASSRCTSPAMATISTSARR